MARSSTPPSSLESVNEIYKARAGNLEAAEDKDREAAEEDTPTEEVHGELTEEAKFVANPDDLRKEVDSEEEFSAGLEDGEQDTGVPEPGTKATAKKTAAKQS